MRKGQAQQVFKEETEKVGFPTPYNDFSIRDEACREAWDISYWREKDDGPGETARNLAYFRSYFRIALDGALASVGDALPAGGIRIEPRGRIWMDRYVIGKMHGRGFLKFFEAAGKESTFALTEIGKAWMDQQ